jgi:hypothetical protein
VKLRLQALSQLIFLSSLLIQTSFAFGSQNFCQQIVPQITTIRNTPRIFSQLTWPEYQTRAAAAYESIGELSFTAYLNSDVRPKQVYECLLPEDVQHVRQDQSAVFFSFTLATMMSWNSPLISRFANLIQTRFSNGEIESFGIGQNPDGDQSTAGLRLAGFHRGNRGLYLNPDELPPDQWFLIFFHEFSHALDFKLATESVWAKDPGHLAQLKAVLLKATWTTSDQQTVDAFLTNALNRGLLAEYRAWVSTAHLYLEARRLNKIPVQTWFENLMGPNHTEGPMRMFIFANLDGKFTDPSDDPYDNPRLAARLGQLRSQLRAQAAQGITPNLSSLENL